MLVKPSPYRFDQTNCLERSGKVMSKILEVNDNVHFKVEHGNCDGMVKSLRQAATRHKSYWTAFSYHLTTALKAILIIPGLTKFIRWLKGNDRSNRRAEALENMAGAVVEAAKWINAHNFDSHNRHGAILYIFKNYNVGGCNYLILKNNQIVIQKAMVTPGVSDCLYHKNIIGLKWFSMGDCDNDADYTYKKIPIIANLTSYEKFDQILVPLCKEVCETSKRGAQQISSYVTSNGCKTNFDIIAPDLKSPRSHY
jgi:hypothetical protein